MRPVGISPLRRLGHLLDAFAALLALTCLVVVLPVLLWLEAGPFLPPLGPTVNDMAPVLGARDSGEVFLGLLVAAGFIAWLCFTTSVLLELTARYQRRPLPIVPGLGWSRLLVSTLLTTITVGATGAGLTPPNLAPPLSSVLADAPINTTPVALRAYTTPLAGSPTRQHADHHGYDEQTRRQHRGAGRHNHAHPAVQPAPAPDQGYLVRPGDNLWDIAEDHLDDATHWRQLYELNRDRLQPDGAALTDPALIRPGWTLALPTTIPHTSDHADSRTPAPATDLPPPAQRAIPAPAPPTSTPRPDTAVPGARQLDNTGAATPGDAPRTTAPAPAAGSTAGRPQPHNGEGISAAVLAGISALAAAGLLVVLLSRRFLAARRRRPGMRLRGSRHLGPAETALRTHEDPDMVDRLDTALRALTHTTAENPPALHGAILTPAGINLYLAEDSDEPAPPFRAGATPDVWVLPSTADLPDDDQLDDQPAPYPGMATIGRGPANEMVLLDLESAGAITLTGDTERVTDVLTALAIELAMSSWADHLEVTLVGFGVRLAQALPDRLHYTPDIDTALDGFSARADHTRDAPRNAGAATSIDARTHAVADDSWIPEIILTAEPVTHDQQQRIRRLVASQPQSSLAAVVAAGDQQHRLPGPWHIPVPDDPHQPVTIEALESTPVLLQHCDPLAYQAVLDELDQAQDTTQTPAEGYGPVPDELDELPEQLHDIDPDNPLLAEFDTDDEDPTAQRDTDTSPPSLATPTQQPPATTTTATPPSEPGSETDTTTGTDEHAADEQRTQHTANSIEVAPTAMTAHTPEPEPTADGEPELRILGPVEIAGVDPAKVADSKRARLLELAAYLALYPGRGGEEVSEALGGRHPWAAPTRQSNMSRLRNWLGDDAHGQPYIPPVGDRCGYQLSPNLRWDWQRFQHLARRGLEPDRDRGERVALLEQALRLIRGRPFAGAPAGRYAWADLVQHEITALITDVAHTAADAHLANRDPDAARAALHRGLAADPLSELLYRDLARVEHQAGNLGAIHTIARHLERINDDLGTDPEPETTRLLRQLLDPSSRHTSPVPVR